MYSHILDAIQFEVFAAKLGAVWIGVIAEHVAGRFAC